MTRAHSGLVGGWLLATAFMSSMWLACYLEPEESIDAKVDSGSTADGASEDGHANTSSDATADADADADADAGADADADADAASLCGNGTQDPDEECDLGSASNNGAYGGCNADCTRAAYCGDGVVNGPASTEDCDNGAANDDLDACSSECKQTKLLLWLDATDPNGDSSSLANDTQASAWVDKAAGRSVVQATTSQQPTYKTVGIGTKPAFWFDGSDDLFDVDLDINGSVRPNLTIVVVLQNAAGNTSNYAGVWGHDNGDWDRFLTSGGSSGSHGISNGTGFTSVTGIDAEGEPLVVTTVLQGATSNASKVYVNGTLGATFTGSISEGTSRFSIGNVNGPNGALATHAFDGYIAEVRVYDEAMDDAARESLETRLKTKYDVP